MSSKWRQYRLACNVIYINWWSAGYHRTPRIIWVTGKILPKSCQHFRIVLKVPAIGGLHMTSSKT